MILRHATIAVPAGPLQMHPEKWTVLSPDIDSKANFSAWCLLVEANDGARATGFRRLPMMGAAALRCGPYGESMVGALRRWGLLGEGNTTIADEGLGVVATNQWRQEWAAEEARRREEVRQREAEYRRRTQAQYEARSRADAEAHRRARVDDPFGANEGFPDGFWESFRRAQERVKEERRQQQQAAPPPPPPQPSSHHAALHLLADAPIEVVQAAHRALALLHHPDRGGDVEKLKRINAARDHIVAQHEGRSPRRARGG